MAKLSVVLYGITLVLFSVAVVIAFVSGNAAEFLVAGAVVVFLLAIGVQRFRKSRNYHPRNQTIFVWDYDYSVRQQDSTRQLSRCYDTWIER